MPNIKSAQKRMELSRQAQSRNRAKRSRLRTAIKQVRAANDAEEARERLGQAFSLLDRAAASRLLHPRKAARIKGQLSRHVASLEA
jgi:small subunit ribosomal protein S20